MKNKPEQCLLLRKYFNIMARIFPSNNPFGCKKAILVNDIPNKKKGWTQPELFDITLDEYTIIANLRAF